MKNINIPKWAWDTHQAVQKDACRFNDAFDDEILTYLSEMFASGNLPNSQEELNRKIDNRKATLRRNQRGRIRIYEKKRSEIESLVSRPAADPLANLTILEIRDSLMPKHWKLLVSISAGESYELISKELNFSLPKSKSIVSRIRSRLASEYRVA